MVKEKYKNKIEQLYEMQSEIDERILETEDELEQINSIQSTTKEEMNESVSKIKKK